MQVTVDDTAPEGIAAAIEFSDGVTVRFPFETAKHLWGVLGDAIRAAEQHPDGTEVAADGGADKYGLSCQVWQGAWAGLGWYTTGGGFTRPVMFPTLDIATQVADILNANGVPDGQQWTPTPNPPSGH